MQPLDAASWAMGAALMICGATGAVAAAAEDFPAWAYPGCPAPKSAASADGPLRSVPGSSRQFTAAQISEWSVIKDWFPEEHGALPPVLAASRSRELPACGFCHLPSGGGRPENANLTGLPAPYIVEQVKAFHTEDRRAAMPGWGATLGMIKFSGGLSEVEIADAAEYFSRQRARTWVKVVEGATVPEYSLGCFVFLPTGGPVVPLGRKIIEMPTEPERFELRDPHTEYVAYVPAGSVERGRKLAHSCTTCHGPALQGGSGMRGPPLAGRFAGYLFRQLYGFKTGARRGGATGPMQLLTATMSQEDMIDLAAYAAASPLRE